MCNPKYSSGHWSKPSGLIQQAHHQKLKNLHPYALHGLDQQGIHTPPCNSLLGIDSVV